MGVNWLSARFCPIRSLAFHLFLVPFQTHPSLAADVMATADAVNRTSYYRFLSNSDFSPSPRRPWRLYLEASASCRPRRMAKNRCVWNRSQPYPLFTKWALKALPCGEVVVTTEVVKGVLPLSVRVYTSVNNVDISDPTLLWIIHDIPS